MQRVMRRVLCGGGIVLAAVLGAGCSTLNEVNSLANSLVGGALNTAAKALSPSTYKSASSNNSSGNTIVVPVPAQTSRRSFYTAKPLKVPRSTPPPRTTAGANPRSHGVAGASGLGHGRSSSYAGR